MEKATTSQATSTNSAPSVWYRTPERCEYLGGITAKTMYEWIANRGLPAGRKIGPRTVVFNRAADDAWIAAQPMSDAGQLGKTGLTRSECARKQRATEAGRRSSTNSFASPAGAVT